MNITDNKPVTRQEANRMIADMLIAAIERFPDLRFGQILRLLEIIKEIRDSNGNIIGWQNGIMEEPVDILDRMGHYRKIMKDLGAYLGNNVLMTVRKLKLDKSKKWKLLNDQNTED